MMLERGIAVDHSTIKSGSNKAGLHAINDQFIIFYLLGFPLVHIPEVHSARQDEGKICQASARDR